MPRAINQDIHIYFLHILSSQDAQLQLDGSLRAENDHKEQVLATERSNSLLMSEMEELRGVLEQTDRGRKVTQQELTDASERLGLLQSQVGRRTLLTLISLFTDILYFLLQICKVITSNKDP